MKVYIAPLTVIPLLLSTSALADDWEGDYGYPAQVNNYYPSPPVYY